MSGKKTIFQILGKVLEEAVITPSIRFLEPISRIQSKEENRSVIPPTKAAVFWDYENFPLPKKISAEIFFETLFPSGLKDDYIAKKVYGNPSIVNQQVLGILNEHGFEYSPGLPTGKPSSTDFFISSDCASICSKFSMPVAVIIISGDADLIPLVQNLSLQGHDVRLVCQDKRNISTELHRIVPSIIDRQDIIQGCQNLKHNLISISQLINFIISNSPSQKVSIKELIRELEQQFVQRNTQKLTGQLMFLLNLPDLKWQYEIKGEFVSTILNQVEQEVKNLTPAQNKTIRDSLIMKLGSESDSDLWNKYWSEFENIVPNTNEKEKILKIIYNTCTLPMLRGRIQNKLIQLALSQKELKTKNLPNSQLKCLKCPNKIFNSISALDQHMKDKHSDSEVPEKSIPCPKCNKNFTSMTNRNQHYRIKHSKELFTCSTCGRGFISEKGLKNHLRDKHFYS